MDNSRQSNSHNAIAPEDGDNDDDEQLEKVENDDLTYDEAIDEAFDSEDRNTGKRSVSENEVGLKACCHVYFFSKFRDEVNLLN